MSGFPFAWKGLKRCIKLGTLNFIFALSVLNLIFALSVLNLREGVKMSENNIISKNLFDKVN